MSRFKGQGALEYLLLIGGAVVVAAVVIVLLLGSGSTSANDTESISIKSLCNQKTGLQKQAVPDCDCNALNGSCVGQPGINGRIIWFNNSCYHCQGTYPNCIASKISKIPDPDGPGPQTSVDPTPENCRSN
ncbi:MAG: class III signal peptide-containing protein [Candidatus Diapherotrites archaeon]